MQESRGVPKSRTRADDSCHSLWPSIGPRSGRFELRCEAEERCFISEWRDEVHTHRQPIRGPVKRYRHRGIPRAVKGRGEPNITEQYAVKGIDIWLHQTQHT